MVKTEYIPHEKVKIARQLEGDFFRTKVFEKYNYKCAYCGAKEDLLIHLIQPEYDWVCPYGEEIDCEKCFEEHGTEFNKCLNNCVLLCPECHEKEHQKINGRWVCVTGSKVKTDGRFICSNCGEGVEGYFDFCPNCGMEFIR